MALDDDLWGDIAEAIEAKAQAIIAATGLRGARLTRRGTWPRPELKVVGAPTYVLLDQGFGVQQFMLTYRAQLIVSLAPGRDRAARQSSRLMRDLQTAWRTDVTLDVVGVVDSRILAADPGVYEELLPAEGPLTQTGYQTSIAVQVYEPTTLTA